jgi:ribosomal protein L37AE/L43A
MLRTLPNSNANEAVARPSHCPFCQGRAVDTLAKVITADTSWRCRSCEKTWTIGSLKPLTLR